MVVFLADPTGGEAIDVTCHREILGVDGREGEAVARDEGLDVWWCGVGVDFVSFGRDETCEDVFDCVEVCGVGGCVRDVGLSGHNLEDAVKFYDVVGFVSW